METHLKRPCQWDFLRFAPKLRTHQSVHFLVVVALVSALVGCARVSMGTRQTQLERNLRSIGTSIEQQLHEDGDSFSFSQVCAEIQEVEVAQVETTIWVNDTTWAWSGVASGAISSIALSTILWLVADSNCKFGVCPQFVEGDKHSSLLLGGIGLAATTVGFGFTLYFEMSDTEEESILSVETVRRSATAQCTSSAQSPNLDEGDCTSQSFYVPPTGYLSQVAFAGSISSRAMNKAIADGGEQMMIRLCGEDSSACVDHFRPGLSTWKVRIDRVAMPPQACVMVVVPAALRETWLGTK